MDDLEYRIGRLNIAAGDVLVVKVHRCVSDEKAKAVGQKVKDAVGLPDGIRIFVIDSTMDLSVIRLATDGDGFVRVA